VEEYTTVVFAAGAAIAVIIAATVAWTIVKRRRRRRALQAPLPLIPFSASRVGSPPPPTRPVVTPARWSSDGATTETPVYTRAISDANGRDGGHTRFAPPAGDSHRYTNSDAGEVAGTPSFVAPVGRGSSNAPSVATGNVDRALAETALPEVANGSAVEGASVRYWRPADGTLQFLPGRLEVIAGRDSGQEIRFVRTPGPDGTRVTFGRAEGPPYRHIQLREPTVSRSHARMTLETDSPEPGGPRSAAAAHWRLENLSATNPVVVNGHALGADGSTACSVELVEGDKIEMGEVVFRFHER